MASKPKPGNRTTARAKPAEGIPPPARRGTAQRNTPTPSQEEPAMKKAATRKPFVDRNNSPDGKPRAQTKTQSKPALPKPANAMMADDLEREPIRAFLRIRPQLRDDDGSHVTRAVPYLEPISSTAVRMSVDPSSSQTRSRTSSLPQSSVYTFSHVFPPATSQSEFFEKTTLPLVKDVLEGQSGLLFAYGVTNSGKTYTMQGGRDEGSAGILPRTLDVVFNSIEGLHGDSKFRPVRLQGIEANTPTSSSSQSAQYTRFSGAALADILLDLPATDLDTDPTTFKLDRNHEYTIWLSYAEIYNEKVYDLFASVDDPDGPPSSPSHSHVPRPTSTFLNLPLPSSQSKPILLTRKALPVKPCPPTDNDDEEASAGKYVAGLRQLRVTSAARAKALLRLGQMHRQVFGTLANSQSSRSHAMVTIKVLRVHKGEKNDPTSIQTSRLTLVDLAGSERTRNTHSSGDRLKEAGSINKSLMVLGQCMETMRSNQRALARSLDATVKHASSRVDTKDVRKTLSIVPFRHSKLTEVLMDYFVGEGRVVMIVNVNPYDTGYDENSHVMKFAAVAREVATVAPTAGYRALPVPANPSSIPRSKPSLGVRTSELVPHRRKVTISTGGRGSAVSETHLEVLEEDEEPADGEDDEDDEPINPLVDALFDEIETLRMQLFESEMRSVVVEAVTREEVVHEMEERMQQMEKMYTRRLMQEVEQHEMKMDAKIDLIQRSGMLGAAQRQAQMPMDVDDVASETEGDELEDVSEEEELEEEVYTDTVHSEEKDSDLGESEYDSEESSRSPSPLAGKGALTGKGQSATKHKQSRSSDFQTDDEPISQMTIDEQPDEPKAWPTPPPSQREPEPEPIYPILKAKAKGKVAATRKSTRSTRSSSLTNVVAQTRALTLKDDDDDDDAVVIIPDRTARKAAIANARTSAEYVPQKGETDTAKRKKRQLGKKPVVTEEDLEHAIVASESSQAASRPLRRSTRGAGKA